jgi:hypothetical protein
MKYRNVSREGWCGSGCGAASEEMHDEKYQREDQENVDEEAGDVKCDERRDPDENEQQRESEKGETHDGPPPLMLSPDFVKNYARPIA